MTNERNIVLAGATGDLGQRIARELVSRGATVKALVRRNGAGSGVDALQKLGATLVEVDYERFPELKQACEGAGCVVSALSGLRDVIVQAQTVLLDAAVAAGCKRFIPSDFAIDFDQVPEGANRNFDFRREFKRRLDQAPIAATSILNGAFADLLTGQAPFILPGLRRVLAWGDLHPKMDFTTKDDVAAFTAAAALDPSTPRTLRIAGAQVTVEELAEIASEISGRRFRVFQPGSLARFEQLIALTRRLAPGKDDVFPPWQGMQYMRDMFAGRGRLEQLDNARYPGLRFTTVRELLANDPRLRRA